MPGELIKQQLQLGIYTTVGSAVRSISAKGGGLRGFYTGFRAVCLRDIPYTMLELGLYESAQAAWRLLTRRSSLGARTRLAAAALSGGMSAVLVWRVTVPRVTTN